MPGRLIDSRKTDHFSPHRRPPHEVDRFFRIDRFRVWLLPYTRIETPPKK